MPVVQPGGNVVVPLNDFNQTLVRAFISTNGGASWNSAVTISTVTDHLVAGGLRTSPLPSAAVDGSGIVYVVWQDCRFRPRCSSNDLILSRSADGIHWTAPLRIPIDATTSTVDHFIPGLGADPASGGNSARLALAYYFYPVANCSTASCQLQVGFLSSPNGGAAWTTPQPLTGPMSLRQLPATRDGLMVGDYIATTFASGVPVPVFAIALPPAGMPFNEAMYVPKRPVVLNQQHLRRAGQDRPVPGVASDHPPRRPRPIR